jgi:magnesium transporter
VLLISSTLDLFFFFSQTEFDTDGNYHSKVARKSEVLFRHEIQPRDIRFSTFSSLVVRANSIILRLKHIKAIINSDSLVLLDSNHHSIKEFLPELKLKITSCKDDSPFEFVVLEAMLMEMFSSLDDRLAELGQALKDVLHRLLDPQLFSVDRGELHILLQHSKSLSEFHSIVKDIEATLTDVLDSEEDMADMYLTHFADTGEYRDEEDIEDINNILEAYLMQAENMMSEIQTLRDSIDQSESIILINLDSQRNVMMRLSLQLEMGVFSATISGLIGMAFGMNLGSSLEENPYAFWVTTGCMMMLCGLLWKRLLSILFSSLTRSPPPRRLTPPTSSRSRGR